MSRHLLIAAATCNYKNLKPGDQRPQLSSVLASMVKLFTETLGSYQRELDAIAENPPSDVLRRTLGKWFSSAERDPADWVVFYYTGHADLVGSDSLYLLTSDFEPGDPTGTAYPIALLADAAMGLRRTGRPARVRNLLVIVDTCFAGEGVVELAGRLEDVFRRSSGSSFYMLGAALPRQEAKAGALANALIESIEDLARRNVTQEWIFFDQILPAINQRLRVHDAVLSMVTSTREEQKFFPNPSFIRLKTDAVQANEAQRAITDEEFRDHWGPRGRGVEFDTQPGSYFYGRGAVLEKLNSYLTDPANNRTHVVTGRPGAGKSAILSRLVTESTEGRAGAPIDLAIHAKGKTLDDVVRRVSGALNAPPSTKAILNSLITSAKPMRVVVDALDEAAEPSAIAQQLLAPLHSVESVKLIVGTRAAHVASLGSAEVIDIDRPEHARKEDIAEYVRARLMRANEPPQPTPYAGKARLARQVADMVAEGAYPNFLIARLVVEDLLSRPKALNPRSPGALEFPTKVSVAFDAYLARFGARETEVRNLLLPLAFAEGQGLPWDNVWPALASALSRTEYGDEGIRRLLATAGAFILETAEEGSTVYRLYHQALADALRRGWKRRTVDRTFTNMLTSLTPRLGGTKTPNWLLANRYTRSHLATHAGRCGKLGELLTDPLYLLAAHPRRLPAAIAAYRRDLPGPLVSFYRSAVHLIRDQTADVAASHMELLARQRGLTEMADRIAAMPVAMPWRAPWAQWTAGSPSQSLGHGSSEITGLAVADWGVGRKVALVGRRNGTAEIWDIASGEQLLQWTVPDYGPCLELALTSADLGPLLIVSWSDSHIGRCTAGGESLTLWVGRGMEGAVTSLGLTEINRRPVCITAHADRRLAIRDVRTLEVIREKTSLEMAKMYELYAVEEKGRHLLWTAGDSVRPQLEPNDPSKLRLWSLDDLSLLWEDARGEDGCYLFMEPVTIARKNLVIFSQHRYGPPEIWDLEKRRMLLRGNQRLSRAWIHPFRGETLLIGVRSGELQVERIVVKESGSRLVLETIPEGGGIEVRGDRFTRIFSLHGRATFLSASLDHVRIWDVDELLDERYSGKSAVLVREPRVGAVAALAAQKGSSDRLLASTGGMLVALEASSGVVLWSKSGIPGHFGDVCSLPEAGVVLADLGGTVFVLQPESGESARPAIQTGCEIETMRAVRWQEQNLLFVTARSGGNWAARVWDVDSGQEVSTSLAYQLYSGEEDKTMDGLAVHATASCVRLAFASSYGKVMVADFTGPIAQRHHFPAQYETWYMPNAGDHYIRCLAIGTYNGNVWLVAGSANGHLASWDFLAGSGKHPRARSRAHVEAVRALSFGTIDGQTVLASGGDDGALCVWSVEFELLFRVEIGEKIAAIEWTGPNRVAIGTARGAVQIAWPPRPDPSPYSSESAFQRQGE